MQKSSESTAITEEQTQEKLNNFKERATDLLNKMNISEKELVKFSSELRLQPPN
jgi:putative heme degradation protein